jgi:hypothetical protein
MSHHKLRACGVRFDTADRIVANLPDERHPSPLLGGRPRPVPALLHGHYALLHLVALDIAVLTAGAALRPPVQRSLRRHLAMIGEGDLTFRRHLVVDTAGAGFVTGMRRWQRRLIAEARLWT